MPTNNTAKAIETRFSVPTASAAKPTVSASPSSSVARIGTISRHERTARNSHSAISSVLPIAAAAMPCATVANSSSDRATEPVTRTCAVPACTAGSRAMAARSARVAAPPGCSAP
jgi:hypothetical protein